MRFQAFSLSLFTSYSLLVAAQTFPNSTNGPSCGALKADDTFFSVVGIQFTGIEPRRELRELEKDSEVWNMFLQALARFQAMDEKDKVSYFQIASIHGAPFQSWDKVTGAPGQEMKGYCTHGSNLFGPWHRPYLALFEQILHDRAVDIAKEYPAGTARDQAMKIAHKVRLPFWDWAINPPDSAEGVIPRSMRRPTASVTLPNGTKCEILNPLRRFDFHPLRYNDFSALSEFQFKNWNHTIRYPLDGFALNATSRDDAVNERIGKQQPSLRDMLYKLLTTYQPFAQVSNKANGGTIGNFETLHDGLHNAFGLGHMGIVEVSAFDPVFWMHHCNMDRIYALFQYRFPDTWVEEAEQAMGTFTMPKGSKQGADSPLAPFHMNSDGDMWTSTTSRNWTSFGYTYPELIGNPSNETFTATLNKLYKPAIQGIGNYTNTTMPNIPGGNSSNSSSQATDWLCEVNMPTDIKVSYSVRIFLGEPSTDPKKWPTDPNYVGQLATLSSSRMDSSIIVSGSIGLTEKLALKHQSGDLKSLDKDEVSAYLKQKFTWRIQAMDFTEIPRNNPPNGLNVTVYSRPVRIPTSDTQVPTWNGEKELRPEIVGTVPIYNGPGKDGTNSTIPAGEVGGSYNASSGEFEWKNGTSSGVAQGSARASSQVRSSSTILSFSASSPAVVSSVTPAPDSTTTTRGPQTKYVTEIVYVTA